MLVWSFLKTSKAEYLQFIYIGHLKALCELCLLILFLKADLGEFLLNPGTQPFVYKCMCVCIYMFLYGFCFYGPA